MSANTGVALALITRPQMYPEAMISDDVRDITLTGMLTAEAFATVDNVWASVLSTITSSIAYDPPTKLTDAELGLVAAIESAGGNATSVGGDVVANTAGIITLGTVADFDLDALDRVHRTNIRGTFVVNQQAARKVREGGRPDRRVSRRCPARWINRQVIYANGGAV